jgi:type IV pilus assembly protein PilV
MMKKMRADYSFPGRTRGVTLIEVLVALVIMLFGLLALAGLLARTHTAEFESYQRKQAVIMLDDIVGRISANRNAAGCYSFTNVAAGTPYLGTSGSSVPACATGLGTPVIPSTEQAARAVADLTDWNTLLQGGSEVIGTATKVGVALDARGCIMTQATVAGQYTEYLVSVTWRGTSPLSMPVGASACAKNSYDANDEFRRIVSTVVRVPVLN